ncbi:hypothetical protein [Halorubellus litoreus]|uniref:Uncharacterized protein n=1 Tax=Halorubellus litoreus TaxID=755308 RepID=A0ABD5VLL8_9EURY
MPDGALTISCFSAKQANELTRILYDENPGSLYHVEHYPRTHDDTGEWEDILLVIRQLSHHDGFGWASSDSHPEPDYWAEDLL